MRSNGTNIATNERVWQRAGYSTGCYGIYHIIFANSIYFGQTGRRISHRFLSGMQEFALKCAPKGFLVKIKEKKIVAHHFVTAQSLRKAIFMFIVLLMIICFGGFYLIPTIPVRNIPKQSTYNFHDSDGACDDTLLTVKLNDFDDIS